MKIKFTLLIFFLALTKLFAQGSTVSVEAPNGGESWKSGTSQNIKWNYTNITNVKIDYSTDNGTNWILIATNIPATDKNFNWNVPVTPSTNCKVKISDAANPLISDQSDNVFTIPNLQVTSPNGGERWQSGTSHNITWNSINISNVKIEYSTNNGSTWIEIIGSYPASSYSYSWTVPNSPSSQYKIRLSDASNPTVYDISDNVFTTVNLSLTSPNGYENWMVSSVYPITWNSYNVNSVRVYLSTNNGSTWDVEITSQLANQSQNYAEWTTADLPSDQCKIKICDATDASIYDVSDNSFIISKLVLLSPNGGENYLTGQIQNITWQRSNNINNVKLEYSTNNGSTWITIANSISAASGSYAWTIPNLTTNSCKVKISNVAASQISDISNNVFSIAKSINVTSPNGSEQWIVGTKHNITWSTSVNNVKIEYSTDNGTNWILVTSPIAGNTGTYQWTIPYTLSSNCKIRISDINNLSNFDESDNLFQITNSASINITAPTTGANWQAETTQNITWQSENVTNVSIEYSINNGVSWTYITGSTPSDGSYLWQVPANPSTQCKIRISDASYPGTFNESNVFIISYLKVLSPNGGENRLVDSSYTIKWNSYNINSFKIYLSRDNGINWTDITSSLSNVTSNSAVWQVDDPVSDQCKIKVSDANNLSIYDTSKSVFSISTLKLITPVGGENLQSGTIQNITWRSNYTGNVTIEYSGNNGSTWNLISTVPGNSGSCSWTVPAATSNQYKIRIVDALAPSLVYDVSKTTFTVSSLTLTVPNGNEKWYIGSTQSIRWTSINISRVKIQYSINNGVDWIDIETNYSSAGIYSWTVPSTPSAQCRVKISSADANCLSNDVSDNIFTIAPTLKITSPNANENWQVGTKQNVTWTIESSDNPISSVKIEYSTNNGSNWNVVAASVTANTGTYQWTVPNTPSNLCRLRVSNAAQSNSYDISDGCFSISSLTVVSPNGGENWQIDSTRKITWVSSYVNLINIEYSSNNGSSWNSIATNISTGAGYYNWIVPNTPSTQCKIRLVNTNNLENYDASDNAFSISLLKLTSPNGGESCQIGQIKSISWSSTNITNIKLEYSTNNGNSWNSIISSTSAATGTYNWTIPNTPSLQCKIRISDVSKPEVCDVSDNNFFITTFAVTSPNGGETWQAGSSQNITWSCSSDISNIKIEYSSNNGTGWNTIASSVPASTGTYSWTIPGISSTQCKIKISSVSNSSIYDQSDNNFTIASLTVTSPNGGESCQVGQTFTISWNSSSINNVRLEYSTNNGTSWNLITGSTPAGTGGYAWAVPNTPSSQCKIKVSDATKSEIFDISDNVFFISTLVVSSPNGGETWQAGASQNIIWNYSPDISNIKIEYSSNSGTGWNTITSSTPASNRTYSWTIPDISSTQCKVKISSVSNPTISDQSDNNFTIASLNITYPNGGEECQAGQTINILWNSTNITNVKLEYSTNNGTSWNVITNSTPAGTGTFSWVVANTPSPQCKIRISDAAKPDIFDITDNSFAINLKTTLQIITPNGGENWQAGSSKLISWSSENVSRVKLEYSLNNGTEWILIADSITSSGTYQWTVPQNTSIQCKIKITDIKNDANYDISDKIFKISNIELTKPQNNDRYLIGSKQIISWVSTNIDNIKIEYSTDDGTNWNLVVASYPAGSLSYEWAVPKTPSSSCKIKLSDAANSEISCKSSNTFIISSIAIISPDENENWRANSIQKIRWNCASETKKVKIEYSTDRGVNWNTIIPSYPASIKYYDWVVPDSPSEGCYIKVSDTSDVNIYDINKNSFVISILKVTAPNGGEKWISGSTQSIGWNSKYISSVNIYYSINNGTDWISIADSLPSTGSLDWVIPSASSTQCILKVCSTKENSVEDISDNTFEIKTLSSISEKLKDIPDNYVLLQNYPNPFNPATTIWYSVPELSQIEIKIYNSLGKEIATLVDGEKKAGNYMVVFSAKERSGHFGNAADLPSGVYFYRMVAISSGNSNKTFIDTKKFILLK